ncbi:GH43 family beta-xylosidase [Nakamurella flavida]|uniref:family 43 glycosylhydrolase n=1 Tax=Nakamurella flavida TaxID=363630 RepID=UPI002786CAED|nr:family 43 glycosylhydrolase [Nakamurella flavida]MDP9778432.1 GH43 family beta-xylosidase [Nakamurella flavida]
MTSTLRSPRRPIAALAVLVTALGLATVPTSVAAAAPPASALVARYDFSAVSGTTVPDASGNGRTATLVGSGATVSGKELTLPGGGNGSGGAYVQLPTGLFDGRDTLTVSAWLKNGTGSGNYAALFFGTTENLPAQYWLLNPADPAGRFKSVITGDLNAAQPYLTETGISPTTPARGVPGPLTDAAWGLYTTVITPTTITGYYNGRKIGTVSTSRTVSQFGSNLVGYIGRSSYPDMLYRGGVRDVSVWSTAFTETDAAAAYYAGLGDDAAVDAALAADAAGITVPTRTAADLTLPTAGGNGSTVTWASSDPSRLTADGRVVRGQEDVAVTLTATLELAGRTVTRAFPVTVLADSPQRNLQITAEGFDLAIAVVTADITLPTSVGDAAVAWSSSNPAVLGATGTVTRPAADTPVTLTAVFSANGLTEARTYPVTVLAADAGRLASYIRPGDTERTDALHLAASTGAGTFTALNNGRPVLFPGQGVAKMGAPTVFRKPDGSFGVVATVDGSNDVYVYDSADLITFTGERQVRFNGQGLSTTSLSVAYDNGIAAYRLNFVATVDGRTYQVTTKDFRTFGPAVLAPAFPAVTGTFPDGALEVSTIGLTKVEIDRVLARYARVVNTGVKPFDDVTVQQGRPAALPTTAEVQYSSGDTTAMGVTWDPADVAALSSAAPGTYTVDGTVQPLTYPDILVSQRADPDVVKGSDGFYYFTASYPMIGSSDPEGYDRVTIRKSATITGLATAPEITIWDEKDSPALNRYIWAPELHQVDGTWYVFFTGSIDNGPFSIRPALLKLNGTDPTDPSKWVEVGRMKAAPGDTAAFAGFSLDMTYFENAGRHYVIWAEKPNASTLRMATVDPANPAQLTSRSILLSTPTVAWERNAGQNINEGPAVIKRNGKVYVSFSGSTVDANYAVGLLSADEGADLMDPAVWTKNPYPVLQSADLPGQVGPGHNSFTVDQYGNPVIVFHSRTAGEVSGPGDQGDGGLFDPGRHARAKTVHFRADGFPVLNMTPAEELAEQYRAVQVRVVVAGEVDPGVPQAVLNLTTSGAASADGWYRTAVVAAVALPAGAIAADGYRTQLSIDGGAWRTSPAPTTISANGEHTLRTRLIRNSVLVEGSTAERTVRIDRSAPTATATRTPASSGTPRNPVDVVITGKDPVSGIAAVEYQLDGGAWNAVTGPVRVAAVGNHLVSHRATDRAGNLSTVRSVAVIISADVPTALVASSGGRVAAGAPVTFTLRGFLRYDRVTVRTGTATWATVLTDATGAARVTVTVPADQPKGALVVTAMGSDAAVAATASLTIR